MVVGYRYIKGNKILMFSPKKVNSPLGSSFDEPTFKNQSKIKNLEVKYLKYMDG